MLPIPWAHEVQEKGRSGTAFQPYRKSRVEYSSQEPTDRSCERCFSSEEQRGIRLSPPWQRGNDSSEEHGSGTSPNEVATVETIAAEISTYAHEERSGW